MRIKHLPWILAAATVVLFTSGYTLMTPTGAPAAKTGSPGDGSNCTECHGGTATTTAGQITSNIPASGYVPGTTYQITATNPLTGSGKMGFEVSPQNAAGTQLGTLVAGAGSKLVGGTKYVTHSNANTTTNTWTFSWVAPVAGTGQVTFYGAFARNKPGPVTKSTLVVEEAASAPGAAGTITGPAAVCKNNTETYSIAAISGATTYVWTVPAGSSILSGQGSTSVSVSFGASSASGNISVYGSNAAGNGAASNKTITVNTTPDPTSNINGNNAPCQSSTQTYSVTNVSGVTYTWVVPAGSVIASGQGTNSINITVGANSGNITVTPSNTCGSGTSANHSIAVGLAPSTPVSPDGPALVDVQNTSTSNYTTSTVANSYVWQISPANAGSISGTTSTAVVTWNNSFIGNAEIRVKGVNTCGESAWSLVKTTQVINTTGIVENEAGIKVIPGDANQPLTLIMNTEANNANVIIFDLSGRLMYNTTIPGIGTYKINQQLKPGVYVISVKAGSQALNQKIFIN
jgi:hypothetical protein